MLIEKAAEILRRDYGVKKSQNKTNGVKFNVFAGVNDIQTLDSQKTQQSGFISTVSGLGLQLISDDNKKDILKKSKKILDFLRNITLGILEEKINPQDLQGLVDNIESINTEDKQLQEIFEEIKLRAKIEIAKYSS